MAAWQRSLLGRLGLTEPARSVVHRLRSTERAVQSARFFARGYRHGQHFPAPRAPATEAAPATAGPLQAYFDAHTEGPGIWKWRHYFDIYERHLERFRGTPVHIVEIGVLGGGSLQMWHDYFGPETHVYGIDINPDSRKLTRDGVEIFIGDQGDPKFWERFLEGEPTIDVVIDDGGHTARQQAVTIESLLAHVRPGGVYICEDIHGPFQPFHSFVDGLTRPLSDIGLPREPNPANSLQQQIASVHRYPILTVIEKSASATSRFEAPRHGTIWPVRRGRAPKRACDDSPGVGSSL
jgi:SAM-dependent methyltransferase